MGRDEVEVLNRKGGVKCRSLLGSNYSSRTAGVQMTESLLFFCGQYDVKLKRGSSVKLLRLFQGKYY